MPKYSMIMSWSEEDQAYIVSVPELPGCMADGKTPEEAVKQAQIVIDLWIETALEDGETIPEPHLFNATSVQIGGAIKITIQEQIKTAAIHGDVTLAEIAKKVGMSPQSFSNRMKTGKFTRKELDEIGEALGAEYISCFRFPDGAEY